MLIDGRELKEEIRKGTESLKQSTELLKQSTEAVNRTTDTRVVFCGRRSAPAGHSSGSSHLPGS